MKTIHGDYLEHVRRVQEYIRAGDVFQVNLSRLWRVTLPSAMSAAQIYRRLCTANPAPFAGMMTWDKDRAVISSSPERLVAVRGRTVHTRPIAGTYPRSPDADRGSRVVARICCVIPRNAPST